MIAVAQNFVFSFRGKEAFVRRCTKNDLATTVALAAVSFQDQGALNAEEYLEFFIFLAGEPPYDKIILHLLKFYPGMIWTEIPGEPVT